MKKTIICFGDSNTYGYDPVTFTRLPHSKRWPNILSQLLGKDYLIIEEGLCGRTTVFDDPLTEGLSGLEYITPCLMSHNPVDLLIIMLGTNDTKSRFSATSKNIANGLKRLILKAQGTPSWSSCCPNILLISPAPIEEAYYTSMFQNEMGPNCSEKSYALAPLYQEIATELNCHFLDANEICHVHPNDFMHLDEDGHLALATTIAQSFNNYMSY